MRKKVWMLLLLTVAVAAICASAVQSGVLTQPEGEQVSITLYFPGEGDDTLNAPILKTEKRTVTVSDSRNREELARAALQELIRGPTTKRMTAVISPDVAVDWLVLSEDWIGVNFSGNLSGEQKDGGAKEALARYSVVLTLSALGQDLDKKPLIGEVSFYINGQLQMQDEKTTGILLKDDVVDNIEEKPIRYTARLYFPAEEEDLLVSETRTIDARSNQSVEYYIIPELLKGPQTIKGRDLFPSGTAVSEAKTEYNTCYVTLSKDFLTLFNNESLEEQKLCIYSIVNSLTELDSVQTVKFLIEGQEAPSTEEFDLGAKFRRAPELIAGS